VRGLEVPGGSLRLAEEIDVLEPQVRQCGANETGPMGPPRRGVGDDGTGRGCALPLRDKVDDTGDGLREEHLRGKLVPCDEHGNLVAHTPPELADEPFGLREPAAFGSVAEQQLALRGHEHDCRDVIAAAAECHLGGQDAAILSEPGGGGCDAARADVDAQMIGLCHFTLSPPEAVPHLGLPPLGPTLRMLPRV